MTTKKVRAWLPKFLDALQETANVTAACAEAHVSRKTAYKFRNENAGFMAEWDAALAVGVGTLEDEAIRRARDGVEEPIYSKGEYVGTTRRYSDTLLIFLLKSHKPSIYNTPQRLEGTGPDGAIVLRWADSTLTDNGNGEETDSRS